MKYFRVHMKDCAYITKQTRGIFTAVGKLVDSKTLTEEEEKEYWRNREYFERVLPVPPFYEKNNPEGAITWFKRPEKYVVKLTHMEKRVLRESMVEYRNLLIKRCRPTEDVDRILLRLCK